MTYELCVPMPLQVVIDDVGWRNGEDGSLRKQPYRTGIDRLHVPADYDAIVALGRRLNMRPQAGMILGEWDVDNALRTIPTASWMGDSWGNSRNVGPWIEQAAERMNHGREHIELTLHGLMHEYWDGDTMTRAEWADINGRMRPRDEVTARLDLYAALLDRHSLGAMPTSFIPCAFLHSFGHPQENIAEILATYGLNFISTPFDLMAKARPTEHSYFGFDHGLLVIDRGQCRLPWNVFGCDSAELSIGDGPIVGLHWPNVLHRDPARHDEVVERWFVVLREAGERFDRMLARDTKTFAAQLLHHIYTRVTVKGRDVVIDARDVFTLPVRCRLDSPVTFKLRDAAGRITVQTAEVNSNQLQVRVPLESHDKRR